MDDLEREKVISAVRSFLENPLATEFSTGKLGRWREALSKVKWETRSVGRRQLENDASEVEFADEDHASVSIDAQLVGQVELADGRTSSFRRQLRGSAQLVRETSSWKVLDFPAYLSNSTIGEQLTEPVNCSTELGEIATHVVAVLVEQHSVQLILDLDNRTEQLPIDRAWVGRHRTWRWRWSGAASAAAAIPPNSTTRTWIASGLTMQPST